MRAGGDQRELLVGGEPLLEVRGHADGEARDVRGLNPVEKLRCVLGSLRRSVLRDRALHRNDSPAVRGLDNHTKRAPSKDLDGFRKDNVLERDEPQAVRHFLVPLHPPVDEAAEEEDDGDDDRDDEDPDLDALAADLGGSALALAHAVRARDKAVVQARAHVHRDEKRRGKQLLVAVRDLNEHVAFKLVREREDKGPFLLASLPHDRLRALALVERDLELPRPPERVVRDLHPDRFELDCEGAHGHLGARGPERVVVEELVHFNFGGLFTRLADAALVARWARKPCILARLRDVLPAQLVGARRTRDCIVQFRSAEAHMSFPAGVPRHGSDTDLQVARDSLRNRSHKAR
mmetsp:Transcript_19587/g.46534  ORF Transcript_19587/g.46534 Transcript_19587/m.46534 type:complete len:349 (-) Transcript_19587:1003-2049(-)